MGDLGFLMSIVGPDCDTTGGSSRGASASTASINLIKSLTGAFITINYGRLAGTVTIAHHWPL